MDGTVRIRCDAEAPLVITMQRWIVGCVVGCLVLAVVLLPPQPNDEAFYSWTPPRDKQERGLELRAQARRVHADLLWQASRGAHDIETARRVFGATSAPAAAAQNVSVWFDPDVSAATRAAITTLLSPAHSGLGAWQGKGAVGVLVMTDTATTFDGIRLPWGYNSGLVASTKVLLPTREMGNRCVTVVRIGHRALTDHVAFSPDFGLLDGCAFYDAFGTPGPQIAAWLTSERFSFSRSLSFAPPDSAATAAERWGYDNYFWTDENYARCGGGDLNACSAMLREPKSSYMWSYWHDNSVSPPAESDEITEASRGFNSTLLSAMVRDIGPGRFERVWQSPHPLEAAYLAATGEPLAAWLNRRVVAFGGPYHIGPLPTPTSAVLTVLAILLALPLAARLAPRPRAA